MAAPIAVRFRPSGRRVTVAPGTSLMEATRHAGLPLGSSCDGAGACGWCRVTVVEGAAEALSAVDGREQALLDKIGAAADERIACQSRVRAPVTITAGYW